MERFSTWRDPATGIAAFVQPKPPAEQTSVIVLAATPLFWALAALRLAILAVLLSAKLLLIDVALLFSAIPALHLPLSHAVNGLTCRLMLFVLGFYFISSEEARPKTRAKPGASTHRSGHKVVIANWSSPIDVLYLVFRYNVDKFLLPVVATQPAEPNPRQGNKVDRVAVVGVKSVGFFRAVMATGYPPLVYQPGQKYLTLAEGIATSRTACAIFPEGTSSNNRGLLRFADVPLGAAPQADLRLVSLRYDTPATLKPSAALPAPTLCNPLGQLLRLAASPLPQGLLVRSLPPLDAPTMGGKGGSTEFWEQCASSIAAVGRWKRMPSLGFEEKWGFLTYSKVKR